MVKSFEPLKTTVKRYADVFEQLGCPLDLQNPEFPDKPRTQFLRFII